MINFTGLTLQSLYLYLLLYKSCSFIYLILQFNVLRVSSGWTLQWERYASDKVCALC